MPNKKPVLWALKANIKKENRGSEQEKALNLIIPIKLFLAPI